jgi:hypothetical protein
MCNLRMGRPLTVRDDCRCNEECRPSNMKGRHSAPSLTFRGRGRPLRRAGRVVCRCPQSVALPTCSPAQRDASPRPLFSLLFALFSQFGVFFPFRCVLYMHGGDQPDRDHLYGPIPPLARLRPKSYVLNPICRPAGKDNPMPGIANLPGTPTLTTKIPRKNARRSGPNP